MNCCSCYWMSSIVVVVKRGSEIKLNLYELWWWRYMDSIPKGIVCVLCIVLECAEELILIYYQKRASLVYRFERGENLLVTQDNFTSSIHLHTHPSIHSLTHFVVWFCILLCCKWHFYFSTLAFLFIFGKDWITTLGWHKIGSNYLLLMSMVTTW